LRCADAILTTNSDSVGQNTIGNYGLNDFVTVLLDFFFFQ